MPRIPKDISRDNSNESGSRTPAGNVGFLGQSSGPVSSKEIDSPFGPILGMHHTGGNKYGGTHHTVYTDGGRFSWDTNGKGEVVPNTAHSTKQ